MQVTELQNVASAMVDWHAADLRKNGWTNRPDAPTPNFTGDGGSIAVFQVWPQVKRSTRTGIFDCRKLLPLRNSAA
jgi:hypothetical protein